MAVNLEYHVLYYSSDMNNRTKLPIVLPYIKMHNHVMLPTSHQVLK